MAVRCVCKKPVSFSRQNVYVNHMNEMKGHFVCNTNIVVPCCILSKPLSIDLCTMKRAYVLAILGVAMLCALPAVRAGTWAPPCLVIYAYTAFPLVGGSFARKRPPTVANHAWQRRRVPLSAHVSLSVDMSMLLCHMLMTVRAVAPSSELSALDLGHRGATSICPLVSTT